MSQEERIREAFEKVVKEIISGLCDYKDNGECAEYFGATFENQHGEEFVDELLRISKSRDAEVERLKKLIKTYSNSRRKIRIELREIKAKYNEANIENSSMLVAIGNLEEELTTLREQIEEMKGILDDVFGIAETAPELNMGNYDHHDVQVLNDSMTVIYNIIDAWKGEVNNGH